ncbi:MAG: type II toxin-antitoxin system VapC family toxin [Chlamydiae bacterium]|nr:type II toxin-antitoxin system VapC family toxin [Chlamydiota bacterium]MBI3278063.1 type II toxin-antitoxin system VapC family toxin [Chlamydiota bacterium]
MIVVDVNILAYLLIQGIHTSSVERVYAKDAEWAAPFLWRSELRNILAGYIRVNKMPLEMAITIVKEAEVLMGAHEYSVSTKQILNLVASSTCSAYDCEYVGLAQESGTPLVTMDREILKNFPEIATSIEGFLSENL